MRYAVIDIGSNTIRMVICTYENGQAEISGNERISSIILRCVKDGRLTLEGINFLIDSINHMKSQCGEVDNIFAFATASLRGIDNAQDVCTIVRESTGVDMRIISGEEEAEYDFYSLSFLGKTDTKGMGLDLGGGSCQLFSFEDKKLIECTSMLIGSSRMHSRFVAGDIPTPDEARAIYDYIQGEISKYTGFVGFDDIYAIGGSARCAVALYNLVFKEKIYNEITADNLERLCKYLLENPEKAKDVLNASFPDRLLSLVPGMITLLSICRYVGAKRLVIAVCGVREGFIFKEIMR